MLRFRFCIVLLSAVFGAQVAASDITGTVHVSDADTIRINGIPIRLHAIDAPESDQRCGGANQPQWQCGLWSKSKAQDLFQGRVARCEKVDIDKYNRVVARCFVEGQDMGRVLVQNGLAFAYRKYGWDYDLDEKAAAIAERGLHATQIVAPEQFRHHARQARAKWALADAPVGCLIKGNISRKGARIFHVPGQKWYDETRIRPDQGERWFCSPDEARKAGWRMARD